MNELRCESTMHGRLVDATHLEVKCWRRRCGYRKGIVVLHIFDLRTGMLQTTKRFAAPQNTEKGNQNVLGTDPSIRSA